ncbi:MAG: hypothetical protein L6Q76_22085, partial [Polyangiaceae bacterium]|nr:hypothetical protein [Polyangiaceae bacterium]
MPLDLEKPMLSLREAAGIPTYYSAAKLRGVAPSPQAEAEARGPAVKLATLIHAAEVFGGRLELRFFPESPSPIASQTGRRR